MPMPDRVRACHHDLNEAERAALLALITEQERAQDRLIAELHTRVGVDQSWVAIARQDLSAAIADLHRAVSRSVCV